MAGNSKRHVLFLDLLKKTPEASLLREFFSKPFSQGTMSIFPHHEQGFDKVKSLGKVRGGGPGEDADVPVTMVSRYDLNIASGIIHTIKEYEATDIVIGLHRKAL